MFSRYLRGLVFYTALTIFSGLIVIIYNQCGKYYSILSSKLEITLFLRDGLNNRDIAQLREKIKKITEVKEVYYVNKNTALRQFIQNPVLSNAVSMIKENPLPSSFVVVLRRPDFEVQMIEKKMQNFKEIDGVFYNIELIQRLKFVFHIIRYFRICLAVAFGLFAIIFLNVLWNNLRIQPNFWQELRAPIFLSLLSFGIGIWLLKFISLKIVGTNLMFFSWKQLIIWILTIIFSAVIFTFHIWKYEDISLKV